MDLNVAAVIFMGGYVVVIVVAALLMALRSGSATRALTRAVPGGTGSSACRLAIPLGGDVEALGNYRGRVQSVVIGAQSGKLEGITVGSAGGLVEGGRVPASAIVSVAGDVVQITEPFEEPSDDPAVTITLERDAAVKGAEGSRLGKLRQVCLDQDSGVVTGLIASTGWRRARAVFIPIARVRAASPDRLETDLQRSDLAGLQDFAADDQIRDAVLERLSQNPSTHPLVRSLTVEVQNQRVKLRGYLRTQAHAEQVAAVARSVPAVLAVERGIRTDEDLVREVREAISRDLGTSATNLDVRSEFGQVDILGNVRDRQALRRIDAVASRVPGVLVMHNLATVG